MESEVWKDIPGHEGVYQVSNMNRAKSLDRVVVHKNGLKTPKKGVILKLGANNKGYYYVNLWKSNNYKTMLLHVLVAIVFLNHDPLSGLVVDHKDDNKLNCIPSNLSIMTQRQNCSKTKRGSSMYTGVCWDKKSQRWRAGISVKGKSKYIGQFIFEEDARDAYINKLKEIENGF